MNKTETVIPAAPHSPAKPRPRTPHTPHQDKGRRDGEGSRKVQATGKENKEVKEKHRSSPLCLRPNCDLNSPGDQKCGSGQGSVSIILEKSIIC
ncbi:hypothetical protein E2C01_093491 [Portunus trituberculatus]|uniref:Uncharacterized protein n=1 Tax=Portunus trituberculatus TaxID=210409 RepID=A0A5B7JTN8_PORTR|nr:hypothetical protein [Portunus trituberculatus]